MSKLTQKIVRHTLWPVSYFDDVGEQCDEIWTWDPNSQGKYVVGSSFVVETLHPVFLEEARKAAMIADLEAKLEALKS